MSHELQEVIERHLEGHVGLPTPEIVAAICNEYAANSHKEKVLRYFLLESPLRARDLGVLLCGIGRNHAKQVCQDVARMRERRLARGKHPRWEGEQ